MYLYLIKEENDDFENLYKIGVTKRSVKNRLKELQTGNPNKLSIVSIFKSKYPYELENSIHRYYSINNKLNEWFVLEKQDIEKFSEICEKTEKAISSIKNFKDNFDNV